MKKAPKTQRKKKTIVSEICFIYKNSDNNTY